MTLKRSRPSFERLRRGDTSKHGQAPQFVAIVSAATGMEAGELGRLADQCFSASVMTTPVGSGACSLRLVRVSSLQKARLTASPASACLSDVSAGCSTFRPLLFKKK